MIEFEQLIHLVAFYEHQTLSEAAKHLHISQPVLTRSMQKLEEVMGVTLFQRTKNRISFNETGFMAVEYAKRIINDTTDMKKQLQLFDRTLHTFSIGSCAPAPNIHLSQRASQTYPEKTIQSEIKDMDVLIQGLKDKTYTIIIMPYDIDDENIESVPFMEEQLYFSLPFDHPYANKSSLSLKEMDGQKMLLMSNIGFWNQMHQRTMPHTKFLIQQDRSVFYDLIELSTLPSFTSDFMMNLEGKPNNRKIIPIVDEEAHATFYCWYLKENENNLKSFLYHLV
ncbi:LysR family transcriptional regulator [Longibaculum muris]|uniref:LysR family transcriptional regulator n=1 Tax=Longibaculum muris TaxID=1796628 RepID=UPI00189F2FD7|nr:LysR family transcriptional regulator [Longibaculum muris]